MAILARSILPTHTDKADFNGDGFTDLVWSGKDGSLVVWNKDASGIYGVGSTVIPNPDPWNNNFTLKGYGHFDGNNVTDMVWQDRAGGIQIWSFGRDQTFTVTQLYSAPDIQATGDFNGDGKTDLLWYQPEYNQWFSASTEARKIPPIGLGGMTQISADYQLAGIGDFDGDGRDAMLFRSTGGDTLGTFLIQEPVPFTPGAWGMPTRSITFRDPGADWSVLTIGDFNGDRKADIAWQHTNDAGQVDARSVWLMDTGRIIGGDMIYNPGLDWEIRGSGDYNNDGKTDLLAYHTPSGWYAEYLMDGATVTGFGASMPTSGDFWRLGAV